MTFKLNLKTALVSLLVCASSLAVMSTKALADGPAYGEMEPNNSTATANQIVLYDSVGGTLQKGDTDFYKIFIPSSDTYEFFLTGPKSVNATIYDANNKVIYQGNPNESQPAIFDGTLQGLCYVSIKDNQDSNNIDNYEFEFYPKNGQADSIYRFSGKDRYETSFNIFKNNWVSSDYAVITTGETFPDALSAAPLAKKYNAPIILTKPDSLSTDVVSQLKKTGVTKAFLIGAEWAVSKNIENQLVSMGITPTRLYGDDRYNTNLAIAKYLKPNGEVAIATGEDFPDALSIASIAANSNMPILLVNKNTVNDKIINYIKDNNIKKAYIIGGTGVISANSEKYLSQFTSVKRLSGANRYETNVNVLTYFNDRLRLGEVYFATGQNFPDALSGSVLAAAGSHPIVLADNNPDLSTIRYTLKNSGINQCIFGGDGVLPDSVIKGIIH